MNRTDDPVRDAERYAEHLEEISRTMEHLTCIYCGRPIYPGDGFYELEGNVVCEDCLLDYAQRLKKHFVSGT